MTKHISKDGVGLDEPFECVLCHQWITDQFFGNNPWPLVDDEESCCCNDCNNNLVMPAHGRLARSAPVTPASDDD
jgi:hypothetical protein